MTAPEGPTARGAEAALTRFAEITLDERELRARAEALAAPLDGGERASVSLLCFRVCGERFALPAPSVERVFAPQPLRRVPHRSRPAFRGLVAHEGEILPVGSLERLLDLPAPEADRSERAARMLSLGPAGRAWAFEVHGVDGVVSVAEGDLRAAPMTLARALGAATRMLARLPDGGEAAVLDPDTLRAGWEAAAR